MPDKINTADREDKNLKHLVEIKYARFSVTAKGKDADSVILMMTKIFSPRNGLFWIVFIAIGTLWTAAIFALIWMGQGASEVLKHYVLQ